MSVKHLFAPVNRSAVVLKTEGATSTLSHVQYLLSGIERMAVAAEKRSSLSTVAAENERIDWIVFSKLYLFLVRRQVTREIYVVGLPSVVKHKYWISIDMDCRRWMHLQLYQHATICYGWHMFT